MRPYGAFLHLVTAILILAGASTSISAAADQPSPPFACDASNKTTHSFLFCDRSLSIEERARDLVSRLSLEEKISQLSSRSAALPRLGVPYYNWWSEALHGVAKAFGVETGVNFKGSIKTATNFPQVIVTASSFDVDLWYRIGKAVGIEARAIYNEGQSNGTTFWTPNINIFRDPRWGRGQETPGEDPLVTRLYAVSHVRGLQGDSIKGDGLKDGHLLVSACCKHFTAYDLENWNGNGRFTFNAKVTKQDMADTFQPPFQGCVQEGRASGMMCAYNMVNGVPNCADHHLLTTTARGKWGFKGYIVSDCDAVSHIFKYQNFTKSDEDAAAIVLKAGMDIGCGEYLKNHTQGALEQNKITEADINRALYNLFSIRMRLGLFNGDPRQSSYGHLGTHDICSRKHRNLSLQAARQGIVLLKNNDHLLPLSKTKTSSIAVIGPNANDTKVLVGNYAGPPCSPITPLEGLKKYTKTKFLQGCQDVLCSVANVTEAVETAKSADHVVLVMGISQVCEAEDHDRNDLLLPGLQQILLTSIAESAKNPVVLVIFSGGPLDISFAKDNPKIGSILWAGYPGEAGGQALAEIIFGEHNPGGRLTMTWYPQDFTKVPMTDMRIRPDPSSNYPGRTYRFYTGRSIFEFGYGLSYTNYSYKFISVTGPNLDLKNTNSSPYIPVSSINCEKAKFSILVEVENNGNMAGMHPVLLFLRREMARNEAPTKQILAFQNVNLLAGTKATVKFEVNLCQRFARAARDGSMVIDFGDHQFLIVGDQQYPIKIST